MNVIANANPNTEQLHARFVGYVPTKPILGLFENSRHTVLDTRDGDEVPDNYLADRVLRVTCGLIKGLNSLAGRQSAFTLYLDGFSNVVVDTNDTKFEFDSSITGPEVTLVYKTKGARYNNKPSKILGAILRFKDKEQAKQYLVAVASTPEPEVIENTRYVSSGGNEGLALVAGVITGGILFGE